MIAPNAAMRGESAAKTIIEITEDIEDTVHREVGRLMSEGLDSVISIVTPLHTLLSDHPTEHRVIERAINGLTVMRFGYATGSLPRRGK